MKFSLCWSESFPYYADVSLPKTMTVQAIRMSDPAPHHATARLYASLDGLDFARFQPGMNARILRVQLIDSPEAPDTWLTEIDVDAVDANVPDVVADDPILSILPYEEAPVTAGETEAYLSDMVARLLGEAYRAWFCFHIVPSSVDRYEVSVINGVVHVSANCGVTLAVGLYAYLRKCCGVHISEQDAQVRMPDAPPALSQPLTGAAADRIRYANNYCTLSYTMPFWDEAMWQRELDWWALMGVNVVLDFTGMEAVWVLFLRELGCTEAEIDQFIVGPVYTAWQLMQNIQGIGGPVNRRFIADRVRLARANQRKMRVLGMQRVAQGYAGMLPEAVLRHHPELNWFEQGLWSGIQRPGMLDPTSEAFAKIAVAFYRCQDAVLGHCGPYYAIDPYHEGGNRPESLTYAVVAQCIARAMLRHDPDAIWMVQAWRENPSAGFLSGFSPEERKHLLILDLSATDNPLHGPDEFQGTQWIYCMLDMYGGRRSMHGEIEALTNKLPKMRKSSKFMAGLGMSSEATCHNPVIFELLFDMAWHQDEVDATARLYNYADRRYGHVSEAAHMGWSDLLATAYKDPGYSHHGGYTQMFTYRPRLSMHPGEVFNELHSEILKPPYYAPKEFYQAVNKFCEAYGELKDSAAYRYDLADMLRQMLNLMGTETAMECLSMYRKQNVVGFIETSVCFEDMLDACDQVMNLRSDMLLKRWSGLAADSGRLYDDFSADLFAMDSRALITTWGYRETYRGLFDYAYRQYGGLLGTFYRERWAMWFERLRDGLQRGDTSADLTEDEWFAHDWHFVMHGCPAEANAEPLDPEIVFPKVMEIVRKHAVRLGLEC